MIATALAPSLADAGVAAACAAAEAAFDSYRAAGGLPRLLDGVAA